MNKKHTSSMDTEITLEAHALLVGDIVIQQDGSKRYVDLLAWNFGTVDVTLLKNNCSHEDSWADCVDTYTVQNHRKVRVVENRTCNTCFGSGEYHGRGVVENGVFKGFVGPCFACESKGFQNRADILRCWRYNQLNPRRIYG